MPSGTKLFLLAHTWARTRNERHPDVGLEVREERVLCRSHPQLRERVLQTTTQESGAACCTFGVHRYRFRIRGGAHPPLEAVATRPASPPHPTPRRGPFCLY